MTSRVATIGMRHGLDSSPGTPVCPTTAEAVYWRRCQAPLWRASRQSGMCRSAKISKSEHPCMKSRHRHHSGSVHTRFDQVKRRSDEESGNHYDPLVAKQIGPSKAEAGQGNDADTE